MNTRTGTKSQLWALEVDMPNSVKTNVMRVLEAAKVKYEAHFYEADPHLTGADIVTRLGEDASAVFKTLVAVGKSGQHYAFLVPVAGELDLKKAAQAAGEKFIEMIPQKELLPLTGYVHGGCSPIGMRKRMPHFIDASAQAHEVIYMSGGRVGCQVSLGLKDAVRVAELKFADLV